MVSCLRRVKYFNEKPTCRENWCSGLVACFRISKIKALEKSLVLRFGILPPAGQRSQKAHPWREAWCSGLVSCLRWVKDLRKTLWRKGWCSCLVSRLRRVKDLKTNVPGEEKSGSNVYPDGSSLELGQGYPCQGLEPHNGSRVPSSARNSYPFKDGTSQVPIVELHL